MRPLTPHLLTAASIAAVVSVPLACGQPTPPPTPTLRDVTGCATADEALPQAPMPVPALVDGLRGGPVVEWARQMGTTVALVDDRCLAVPPIDPARFDALFELADAVQAVQGGLLLCQLEAGPEIAEDRRTESRSDVHVALPGGVSVFDLGRGMKPLHRTSVPGVHLQQGEPVGVSAVIHTTECDLAGPEGFSACWARQRQLGGAQLVFGTSASLTVEDGEVSGACRVLPRDKVERAASDALRIAGERFAGACAEVRVEPWANDLAVGPDSLQEVDAAIRDTIALLGRADPRVQALHARRARLDEGLRVAASAWVAVAADSAVAIERAVVLPALRQRVSVARALACEAEAVSPESTGPAVGEGERKCTFEVLVENLGDEDVPVGGSGYSVHLGATSAVRAVAQDGTTLPVRWGGEGILPNGVFVGDVPVAVPPGRWARLTLELVAPHAQLAEDRTVLLRIGSDAESGGYFTLR